MRRYIPKELEAKWQQKWQEEELYDPQLPLDPKDKFYVLAEFAYPSGDLHVGHWFTFTGADIFARYKRLQGANVFFPNGFDAFGLPAEGAAIKRGIHPRDWTLSNIERMKEQFQTIAPSFSFKNEVITCLPNYYKWNQWIFIKMFEKGLAYRGKTLSNWCEFDQTVLANENIEAGKCWRCGNEVIQKEVEQWFLKITDYADRLIWETEPKVDWPESARIGQNSWIGKSTGMLIDFSGIEVFTTRPDTIYGATFIVLAPEHPKVKELTTESEKDSVQAYVNTAKTKSELERKENKEKSGVFTGSYVENPFSHEQVPVWVSDYVLWGYGTGAIMAVPAHDERDGEFAQKFNLPVKTVINDQGIIENSSDWDGLKVPDQLEEVFDKVEASGIGKRKVNYHIHDWSISRQRYWGTPVPMIHCEDCGMVPVPLEDLPVELPYEVEYTPKGKAPLETNPEWLHVSCPKCGKDAKRDPETLDTFFDSSWYFLRYIDPRYEQAPFPTDLANQMMPVDIYFGGGEHTLGHTLYSRFFTRFFQDLGILSGDIPEFAARRIQHGIVLGPDGAKMSKSKGNVVNPDDEVKKYGTDAVRIHVAFFMPYDGVGPWISERIWGPYRFIEKVWNLCEKVGDSEPSKGDLYQMHTTIKSVTEDIEAIKFNTAIADLMEWSNYLSKKDHISKLEYQSLLLLLAPFAPYAMEELWAEVGNSSSIHRQAWPKVEEQYLEASEVVIVVQVNGKVRANLTVASSLKENKDEIEALSLKEEKVQKFLDGKNPTKTIFVPGKLINLLV